MLLVRSGFSMPERDGVATSGANGAYWIAYSSNTTNNYRLNIDATDVSLGSIQAARGNSLRCLYIN